MVETRKQKSARRVRPDPGRPVIQDPALHARELELIAERAWYEAEEAEKRAIEACREAGIESWLSWREEQENPLYRAERLVEAGMRRAERAMRQAETASEKATEAAERDVDRAMNEARDNEDPHDHVRHRRRRPYRGD